MPDGKCHVRAEMAEKQFVVDFCHNKCVIDEQHGPEDRFCIGRVVNETTTGKKKKKNVFEDKKWALFLQAYQQQKLGKSQI